MAERFLLSPCRRLTSSTIVNSPLEQTGMSGPNGRQAYRQVQRQG